MANPEEPDRTSWAKHQHVIMAINIKSMNDFEPVDGATPVFYGSNTPFTIPVPSESVQQISITGTNVKKYGDIINPGTPILLVTRVRDIENGDIGDLDKRYIVCSNVAFDNSTITATATTEYKGWIGLPVLINNDMIKKMHIFEHQTKYNSRLKDLITDARDLAKTLVAKKLPADETLTVVKADPLPPNFDDFKTLEEYMQSEPFNMWSTAIREKYPLNKVAENIIKTRFDNAKKHFEKNVSQIRPPPRRHWRGGSPNTNLTGLSDLVENNDNGFKKYVYFLLTQPFYFKLNALTPTMLTKIKSYILSGTNIRPNTSFDEHILQPFTKFAYVEYIVKIPKDTDLAKYGDLSKDGDLIKNLSDLIAHSISTDTVSNFASQIKKDTNNYKQLINTAPRTYYIHIFRFIELIEKQIENTQTLYPSATSPLPEHVTIFIGHALNKIYEHMQQVMPIFDLLSSAEDILIQDKLKSQQQKRLKVYIDDYVSSQNRTDVITYLKINSTEPEWISGNKPWNQRYDIRLKPSSLAGETYQKFNAMILGYKMYPAPFYYVKDKMRKIVAVDGLDGKDGIVTYKTPIKPGQNEIEKVNKYDKYFLFGNYENIFPLYNIKNDAKVSNLENAKNMTAIIEQICTDNKPVFLLGYGASGSGKTSSLIYFNKGKNEDEKNGIVIHLCKKIIEKLNQQGNQVNKVKVVVKEFFTTDKPNAMSSVEYEFNPDLTYDGDIGKPKHAYHVNMNKPVEEFKTMGQVLKQLVDVDRYVKATTNNPQSSRSHVLVCIQFCSEANGVSSIRNLIIGDFAGKENVFQCAEVDTIVSFLNTKIENPESKYLGYPFYSAHLRKSSTRTRKIKGGDKTEGRINNYDADPTTNAMYGPIKLQPYLSNIVDKRTVYNFETPFESGHFIKTDTIEHQEKYIKLAMEYQLDKMFKIKDNTNSVIYESLLAVGDDEYNKLVTKNELVPTNYVIGDPIDIIDKYSLVKIKNDDTDNIAKMIENMCTDLLAKRKSWQKNARKPIQENLSREDVTLLSYYTNCYLTTCHVETEEKSNMLYQCIERFTGVKINDIPNTTNHICRMYGIILCTCYYMYVNYMTPAAVVVDATDPDSADAIKNYIEEINGIIAKYTARESKQVLSPLYADVLSASTNAILTINKDLKPPPPKRQNRTNAGAEDGVEAEDEVEAEANTSLTYAIADAIQIVTEMYNKVSGINGFEPFKYYQTGMTIIGATNRPGKIINIKFGKFWNFGQVVETDSLFESISYNLKPIHLVSEPEIKFFPDKWGFPVLAGVENGHIELLKLIILEDLFEVQTCADGAAAFTTLNPGLELNRTAIFQKVTTTSKNPAENDKMTTKAQADNKKQMEDAIRSVRNKYNFPADAKKNDINSYKFIDNIYLNILLSSNPARNTPKADDYDMYFVSTINNMINFISKKPTNNDISKTNNVSPFLCSQITDDVIRQLLEKFPDDLAEYSIVVTNPEKIPTYADKFGGDRPKPIPIVKTFTITGLSEHIMTTRFGFLSPFFEIKGGIYCETTKKGACIHNYVNELKYILDSLQVGVNSNNDMYNYLMYIKQSKYIITQTMVRLKYGKQICENRVIEGKYINSSLDQIRTAIKYILNKKHETSDELFHSPDFIDICLRSYCPSGINCFNTSSTDTAPESLIDEIYNHIHSTMDTKNATDYTKDQFYKDIVISIFGVFNVSRLADNPPPVPYIDINHLKQIYYNNDSEYSEKYPLLWALHELKVQIEKLPKQNIKMLPLIEYITEDADKKDTKLPLIDALMELINDAIADYKDHNEDEDILSKERKAISYYFMNTLKEIIEAIDIHNAASTIGTLEFLDQLAKFNSVNNLCYKNVIPDTTPYLDDSEYDKYFATAMNLK